MGSQSQTCSSSNLNYTSWKSHKQAARTSKSESRPVRRDDEQDTARFHQPKKHSKSNTKTRRLSEKRQSTERSQPQEMGASNRTAQVIPVSSASSLSTSTNSSVYHVDKGPFASRKINLMQADADMQVSDRFRRRRSTSHITGSQGPYVMESSSNQWHEDSRRTSTTVTATVRSSEDSLSSQGSLFRYSDTPVHPQAMLTKAAQMDETNHSNTGHSDAYLFSCSSDASASFQGTKMKQMNDVLRWHEGEAKRGKGSSGNASGRSGSRSGQSHKNRNRRRRRRRKEKNKKMGERGNKAVDDRKRVGQQNSNSSQDLSQQEISAHTIRFYSAGIPMQPSLPAVSPQHGGHPPPTGDKQVNRNTSRTGVRGNGMFKRFSSLFNKQK